MKTFFLFAGPNGSGKSTTIARTLENNPECLYLNADYCAKSDPDIAAMQEGPKKSIRAQKETERQLIEMINAGKQIAWETVFSHESRFEIMEYAKKHGYYIHLTYIMTKEPSINIQRVQKRAKSGGHDVPRDKVTARYYRSVGFLPAMIQKADEAHVYDNSGENCDPCLVFQKTSGNSEYIMTAKDHLSSDVYLWTLHNVAEPLERAGILVVHKGRI